MNEQEQGQTPLEFLRTFTNAPNEEQINVYKQSAPGGRVRLFTSSDGKRAYILRGISGLELQKIQEGFLNTVTPERYASKLKTELASRCVIWTSTTPTGKMSEIELQGSGAGLVDTLHEIISELSDYMESPAIARFSGDL